MLISSMKRLSSGFTLIELLIVIAVLGILAVAVLSAINPIEQINRSRDTGSRSDAEQLIGGVDRFYASAGYYPWKTSPTTPVSDITVWAVVDSTWTDGTTQVLNKLSAAGTGELKTSFTTRITGGGYNDLWKYNRGTSGDSTYVCFVAQSSAFATEAWVRCGSTTAGTGLPVDLRPNAAAICLGAALKNMSCLP